MSKNKKAKNIAMKKITMPYSEYLNDLEKTQQNGIQKGVAIAKLIFTQLKNKKYIDAFETAYCFDISDDQFYEMISILGISKDKINKILDDHFT